MVLLVWSFPHCVVLLHEAFPEFFLQHFTSAIPSFEVCICFSCQRMQPLANLHSCYSEPEDHDSTEPDPSNTECLLLDRGIRSCCHSVMRRSDAVLLSTLLLSVWTRVFTIRVKGLNSQFAYMYNIQLYSFNFKFCVVCISDPSAAARQVAR